METHQNSYHLYLIIFTLGDITRKMIENENAYKYEDEFEHLGRIIYDDFIDLERNLNYHKNRLIILNFNVGLYLGNEPLWEIREKLFQEEVLITEINPVYFKPRLIEKTQKEYNYLVEQYFKLNGQLK